MARAGGAGPERALQGFIVEGEAGQAAQRSVAAGRDEERRRRPGTARRPGSAGDAATCVHRAAGRSRLGVAPAAGRQPARQPAADAAAGCQCCLPVSLYDAAAAAAAAAGRRADNAYWLLRQGRVFPLARVQGRCVPVGGQPVQLVGEIARRGRGGPGAGAGCDATCCVSRQSLASSHPGGTAPLAGQRSCRPVSAHRCSYDARSDAPRTRASLTAASAPPRPPARRRGAAHEPARAQALAGPSWQFAATVHASLPRSAAPHGAHRPRRALKRAHSAL